MRFSKHLRFGLLSAGLALGSAGIVRAQDKPPADPPKPANGAGERPRPEGREGQMDPQRMMDRIQQSFKDLNLSDEQKAKIKEITDEARGELAAAIKEVEDIAEPREKMQKLREAMQPIREKLFEVLDETQKEKLRENMRDAGGREGFGGPGGPREGAGSRERGPGGREGRPGERRGPGGPDGAGGPPRGPGAQGGPGGPGGRLDPAMMVERMRDQINKLELTPEQKTKIDALMSETEKQMIDLRAEAEKQAAATRGKFREAMESNKQKLDEILTPEQKQKLEEMMPPRPEGAGGAGGPGGPRGEGRPGREGGPRPEGDRPQGGAPQGEAPKQ